jgi:hypothetical protein
LDPALAELKLVLREHTRLRRSLAAEEFRQSLGRLQSSELRQRENESDVTRAIVSSPLPAKVEPAQAAPAPSMATVSSRVITDPRPLQKLLASAFIVQQSGMDPQSLSALVRGKRSVPLPSQQPAATRSPGQSAIRLSLRQPASEPSWSPPGRRISLAKRWKSIVSIAAALWVVGWGINLAIQPTRSVGASDSQKLSVPQQQPSLATEKPAAYVSTSPAATVPDAATLPARSKWVRIGNNELDYVTDDVTVRYFTPKHAARPVQVGENHVEYLGDDVTVRHFPRAHSVQQAQDHAQPAGSLAQ